MRTLNLLTGLRMFVYCSITEFTYFRSDESVMESEADVLITNLHYSSVLQHITCVQVVLLLKHRNSHYVDALMLLHTNCMHGIAFGMLHYPILAGVFNSVIRVSAILGNGV